MRVRVRLRRTSTDSWQPHARGASSAHAAHPAEPCIPTSQTFYLKSPIWLTTSCLYSLTIQLEAVTPVTGGTAGARPLAAGYDLGAAPFGSNGADLDFIFFLARFASAETVQSASAAVQPSILAILCKILNKLIPACYPSTCLSPLSLADLLILSLTYPLPPASHPLTSLFATHPKTRP